MKAMCGCFDGAPAAAAPTRRAAPTIEPGAMEEDAARRSKNDLVKYNVDRRNCHSQGMGSLALVAAAAAAFTAAAAPPIAPANVSVVWHAPFFSGGGYCSEATTFVLGLAALGVPIGLEPHGDGFDQDYVAGLDDGTLASLRALTAPRRPPPRVAVCHSEPGAWHVLDGPAWQSSACPRRSRLGAPYTIGRTMFETDRLPDGWPERLNAVDEVWAPAGVERRARLFARMSPEDGKTSDPVARGRCPRSSTATSSRPRASGTSRSSASPWTRSGSRRPTTATRCPASPTTRSSS